MATDRPFAELNLWQRIFAEHWAGFVAAYEAEHGREVPEHWVANVRKMLACGDLRRGYYEYACPRCGQTRKVGFTCKSRLCLRCFKGAVDGWLATAQKVLFAGVVHRQVVLTVPPVIRPLILAEPKFLKVFVDAGAKAVQQLVTQWRPKQKIKVGIMAVLPVHGRAGNPNPHWHLVVSEGGLDRQKQWRAITYFDTRKLRKLWQYQVVTALKKAGRGTGCAAGWLGKLGRLFWQYASGFDCHAMPEKGPVERLVIYLCKYVSSPPISLRRIESYDGQRVTFRYEDHRRGLVWETLSAVELIGRMIQHLPAKGFRMVRCYGIYARTVRQKVHEVVAAVLEQMAARRRRVRERFRSGRAAAGAAAGTAVEASSDAGAVRCPGCGRAMVLVRIWDARRGVVYERALPPQVAGSAQAGDLREKVGGVAQLLFGFVENLVGRRGACFGQFQA